MIEAPKLGLRPVVLVGGGGHAAVCLDVFRSAGREVLGYVAPRPSSLDLRHLGDDSNLDRVLADGCDAFVAIGDNAVRLQIVRSLLGRGHTVASVASAHAVVSPSAAVGSGSIVMPGAVVNARTRLADAVIVNTSASVDHDGSVGDGAHIAPGCHLAGAVTIGEGAFLGAGVIVIPERSIAPWSIVGAGAVVTSDLDERGLYVGVPARRRRGDVTG